jgi:hypothetical protein
MEIYKFIFKIKFRRFLLGFLALCRESFMNWHGSCYIGWHATIAGSAVRFGSGTDVQLFDGSGRIL